MRIAEPQGFAADSVKSAVWLAAGFGLLKYALATLTQIAMQHAGYDVFRDELYFIVCGRHLAWGYVDQPPVIPLVARISELLFGLHSLALFRTFASLAGAAEVAITGLLAWRMGGSRWAQALAMTGILLAPMAIGASATFSTSTFEPLFWMTVAFALMELARLSDRGIRSGRTVALWWVLLGVAAGLGLENKWNEVFFLTCLLAALLMTSQRKLLVSKWFPIGLALLVLLILPNLLWEMQHHWATLELLHNDQINGKNVHIGPLQFLLTQILVFGPLMAPLWIGGILWLLFGRSAKMLRFLGVTYVLYLPLMMILHAKDYYLAAIYPLYFAAGAVARDLAFRRPWLRRGLTPAYVAMNAAFIAVLLPIILPVLPPAQIIAYQARIHVQPPKTETATTAALPQYFADMLDWRQKAGMLAAAWYSLPQTERPQAVIYTENYGDASALNVYRPDVPQAISGHQNYFFWGPRSYTGNVMIVFGESRSTLESEFDSVEEFTQDANPYVEPYERGPVFICRGLHENLQALWPKVKNWE
ncbi:ArnT family glycosyltransferase [Tunturiibacter lichenicola]|jgi:4-amino-4-deoxy-L-arabinose transferase-like glycosyltransferase|uniref:ArnT family glycosyltransferase n=1 Tax=Tunturiibacter lichenicola TaxID=2051959 RepID=UPI003D9B47B3